jgi:HEAT repeat protein
VRYDDHALSVKGKKYCKLVIANCSLLIAAAIGLSICNVQFAICNEQSSFPQSPLSARDDSAAVPDPLYDGRTLAEWRDRIQNLDFDDPAIGDDVPGLLAIVEDTEAPWFSRRQAAITLGRIGEPAAEAVPVLIRLLDERGDAADESTELWALKALARFGPVAESAAPMLVEILNDDAEDEFPRIAAIETLGRIGPQRAEVLPALIGVIRPVLESPEVEEHSPELQRAVAAVEMMELFGGNAASAVPVLIQAARSRSMLLRRSAANTLGMIGPAADPAIPTLVDLLLFDESEEVRDLAARALGRIGSASEPPLGQLLTDQDIGVRVRAAQAFGEMTAIEPVSQEALQTAAELDDPTVAVAALTALWKSTGQGELVIPGTLQLLAHPDREVRVRAAELLESLGPAAAPALPKLRELADNGPPDARQAARRILRTLGE